jgi:hypothetical protein
VVEAAGQPVHSFRNGLDYAITPVAKPGAGRVISRHWAIRLCPLILVPAHRMNPAGRSMSLYRAGLGLAPFRPLGVTACRRCRRRQASPM